jgi:hypothetical protein
MREPFNGTGLSVSPIVWKIASPGANPDYMLPDAPVAARLSSSTTSGHGDCAWQAICVPGQRHRSVRQLRRVSQASTDGVHQSPDLALEPTASGEIHAVPGAWH